MKNSDYDEADLLETLGFIAPIPAIMQQRINKEVVFEKHLRGTYLLVPGDIARKFYFIRRGFLRAYFIDENGKTCTSWFMGKGDMMVSVYSFFTQKPSNEFIEVLQDCVLQSITWHELNAYYADFEIGNLLGRIVIQKYYIMSEERAIFLRTHTPEMRYNLLLETNPDIEQLTTLTNIASHIDVSRETLSRLRSKRLKRDSNHKK
ncbi:CRP-like cAMP-binding protein [Pedobacter sp. UYEF25]